jgi:transposase-like protein
MLTRRLRESEEGVLYACREPGCLVGYNSRRGYFLDTTDIENIEQEIAPQVCCPRDGHFMYLVEVMPERRSFRLWKCPECNGSRTNDETSGGLEKKMGA